MKAENIKLNNMHGQVQMMLVVASLPGLFGNSQKQMEWPNSELYAHVCIFVPPSELNVLVVAGARAVRLHQSQTTTQYMYYY